MNAAIELYFWRASARFRCVVLGVRSFWRHRVLGKPYPTIDEIISATLARRRGELIGNLIRGNSLLKKLERGGGK